MKKVMTVSFPELGSRDDNLEINDDHQIDHKSNHEMMRIEQGFMEMSRQISEWTNLVNTLTGKVNSYCRKGTA